MKKYTRHIKGSVLFLCIALLFGFTSHRNKLKKMKDIELHFTNGDNLFITYETVNKLLIQNYDGLKSQRKENIILNKLESNLLSNEMIEDADVYLSVDNKLGVRVTQKTPIARVNQNGLSYYIDSKGNSMPLSSNYSARVPIVEGITESKISKEVYALTKEIYEDDFLKKQIVGIKKTPKNEFILNTRIGNQTVEFGTIHEMDEKIKKLKVFYKKIIKDKTLDKYKKINLVYKNQVVCTKR